MARGRQAASLSARVPRKLRRAKSEPGIGTAAGRSQGEGSETWPRTELGQLDCGKCRAPLVAELVPLLERSLEQEDGSLPVAFATADRSIRDELIDARPFVKESGVLRRQDFAKAAVVIVESPRFERIVGGQRLRQAQKDVEIHRRGGFP